MSKRNRKHYKQQGLTKQEIETYLICKGQCTICFMSGVCTLQNKLKGQNNSKTQKKIKEQNNETESIFVRQKQTDNSSDGR